MQLSPLVLEQTKCVRANFSKNEKNVSSMALRLCLIILLKAIYQLKVDLLIYLCILYPRLIYEKLRLISWSVITLSVAARRHAFNKRPRQLGPLLNCDIYDRGNVRVSSITMFQYCKSPTAE